MDVIGNNIANVNTVGFKAGRVNFQDILSQTFRGGAAPNGDLGSINPAQVGLGVTVAGIDVLHTQGNLQSTGRLTDLAIQGDGFIVMSSGPLLYFTRDGAFDIALDGSLVNPASGLRVTGWQADNAGVVDTTAPVGPLTTQPQRPVWRRSPVREGGRSSLPLTSPRVPGRSLRSRGRPLSRGAAVRRGVVSRAGHRRRAQLRRPRAPAARSGLGWRWPSSSSFWPSASVAGSLARRGPESRRPFGDLFTRVRRVPHPPRGAAMAGS